MLKHRIKHLLLSFAGLAGAYLALFSLPLAAQPADDQAHHAAQPSSIAPQVNQEAAGDPYTLTTCPVSGQALGSMGEPVIYSYQGREIRFCCTGCVSQFEADPAEFIQKVDQSMMGSITRLSAGPAWCRVRNWGAWGGLSISLQQSVVRFAALLHRGISEGSARL